MSAPLAVERLLTIPRDGTTSVLESRERQIRAL